MAEKSGQVGGSTGKSVVWGALAAVAVVIAGFVVFWQVSPGGTDETAAPPHEESTSQSDAAETAEAPATEGAAASVADAPDTVAEAQPENTAEAALKPETADAEDAQSTEEASVGDLATTPEASSDTSSEQADGTSDTASEVPLPAAPRLQAPTFDVVRVEPDGRALIAGRAAPGTRVEVAVDGDVVIDTTTDATGGFVALGNLGLSDEPRALSLRSIEEDGGEATSEGMVVLAPSPEVAEAAEPEITEEPASDSGDTVAVADAEPEPAEPAAPSVIIADGDGVRVLQDGGNAPAGLADNVVIDAITYDETGEVALSGRAPGEGRVQVYVDNEPVEIGEIGSDGQWRADLPDVETGVYTLRVDQVDDEGVVLSRIETPFQREAPEAIRELAVASGDTSGRTTIRLVTIQPGNTLWDLSNRSYGDGALFVRLFEANKDKIRDPDLIYPGQVFSIPN